MITARTLSISKTASELSIAQPAVSKQIKTLEEHLGSQLFIRSRKGVVLTEEGRTLFTKTSDLYAGICKEIDEFRTMKQGLHGNLNVGCLHEVGEKVFLAPISLFKKEHPGLKIQLHFLKAFEIVEKLKSGELDVGIVPNKILHENIRSFEIFDEEIILVTNGQNADKKITKYTDLPYIAYRDNDPLLQLFIRKVSPKSNQSQLNVQMSVNSHKAMASLLQKHPCYAVLPRLSVEEELKAKTLIQVVDTSIMTKLYLIVREVNMPDRKVDVFKAYLMKSFNNYK